MLHLENNKEWESATWRIVGLIILCARFVQGWIFWGGGSRRFIYDPSKLDPYSSQWMANKLQSAMPGALLGMGDAVSFLLQHFILLYTAILLFSLFELICGLGLLFGFFTRLAGFGTALISISLMLLFGWQGSTCMDEWTMAVANLALGLTLALSGGAAYSIDAYLARRHPNLAQKKWFLLLASGPWSYRKLKRTSFIFLIFTILFTLVTYNYFRGSIVTPYHSGPVSAGEHHVALSDGHLNKDGSLSFVAYVNAGTPAVPGHIIRIELVDQKGQILEEWRGQALARLSNDKIKNFYDYNRITPGSFGISAPLSAKAEIMLPPTRAGLNLPSGQFQLQVYMISGERYTLLLHR